ncbi:MAG TPA: hypothetical protein VGK14_10420 [Novimethylophilus sp.]|jgi:tetratricopeptide (TPR) repeat protein|uniref:hypothetical protein n=1 Tax=Novimethylophilus sp. TaxID=2137426 RepID=UPI002F410089
MKKILLICLAAFPAIGHADDAVQACQKALAAGDYNQALQSVRNTQGFESMMCKGRAHQGRGDHADAAATFADAEKSAREPFDQMLAITFRARATQAAGKTDEALGHYDRSLKIARQLGQKQALMINLNESGQLLQNKGDVHAALERYREAYTDAANDNERSECDQLIAAAFSRLGEHDRAIEYQIKSVMLEERSGDFDHYLNAKLELAALAIAAKDFVRAQKELEASLDQAQSAGSSYWEAKALFYKGQLEKARDNSEQARTLLKQALDLANKIGAGSLAGQISSELKQ